MTQNYTLIGYPLGHSMSPWIHEKLFRLSGKQADYSLTEISPEQLSTKIVDLKQLNGFNITIPHKIAVIPFLQKLDESAQRYHAVNCVANTENGSIGYNTDCTGFLRSVQDMPLNGKVLLIGCGGVGRMMATEAVLHHAELTISEPNQTTAETLKNELKTAYPGAKIRLASANDLHEHFDLLMNACPVGMYPKIQNCPVKDEMIENSDNIFDVIYNPTETLLIQKAKAMHKKAVSGCAMLVWQAVKAHEIWYHAEFERSQIENLIAEMQKEVNRLFPISQEES